MEYDRPSDYTLKRYSKKRLIDRSVDELVGMCKMAAADEEITQEEADFLLAWLKNNQEHQDKYPFNVLYQRLDEMLSDGILDEDEQEELLSVMKSIVGGEEDIEGVEQSTSNIFDDPVPDVEFDGKVFVLTGVFTFADRPSCSKIIEDLGGIVKGNVTKATDYLIIGEVASEEWVHTNYGRKIEKAIEYRDRGIGVKIVSETHWVKFLH